MPAPKGNQHAKGNKGGRPSKFKHLDLSKVKKVASKGWTNEEMADFFEVALSTWHKWRVDFVEFSDALKEWKAEADSRVERSLYERALGYSHPEEKIFNNNGEALRVSTTKHYAPDPTSMIFWLKNRQPEQWRDKVDVESRQDIHIHMTDKAKDF
jgi:hypothetical protein